MAFIHTVEMVFIFDDVTGFARTTTVPGATIVVSFWLKSNYKFLSLIQYKPKHELIYSF